MSYSSVKLTKRVIDAASPGAARRIIWDTELRGFGVRVETSGTKSFLIRYRPKGNGRNGPKRFVTIGRYGAMMPEQARNEARSKLAAVARGDGPGRGARPSQGSAYPIAAHRTVSLRAGDSKEEGEYGGALHPLSDRASHPDVG